MSYAVDKNDDQWRAELTPEQYAVLREAGTERPWTGELLDESRAGLYTCAACNAELFKSGTKFDSHCGWPSFYESVRPEAVELIEDRSHGMVRTETVCSQCGAVDELSDEVVAGFAKQLLDAHGFNADLQHLAVPGVCGRCARSSEAVGE